MKRVVLFLVFIFFIGNGISYNIPQIENAVEKKLIKIESNYKQRYNDLYCSKIESYYNSLKNKLIYFKSRYPEYSDILTAIYNVVIKRKTLNQKFCEYKSIQKNTTTVKNKVFKVTKVNAEHKNLRKGDFYLHNKISLADLEELKNTIGIKYTADLKNKISLHNFDNIQDKYNNLYFKIKNKRYLVNGYLLYGYVTNNYSLAKKQILDIANQKGYNLILSRKVSNDKYEFYLTKKNRVNSLWKFNPKKSINYNLSILNKNGGLVINNLFYSYSNTANTIPFGGIFEHNNRLYYFAASNNSVKFILPGSNLYYLAFTKFQKPIVILLNGKSYITEFNTFKYYDLGPVEFYKKIGLLDKIHNFGKILYTTFYNISHGNYIYSLNDVRFLFKLASRFNGKKLSDVYFWILNNMKYNKKISDLVNSRGFSQQQLVEYLKEYPQYNNYWNDFYVLKHKEGVCQTLSDILSLIALINGLNASTVDGITNRGYAHQISEINGYYYDPTFDLSSKSLDHFGMTKNDLKKYFRIK